MTFARDGSKNVRAEVSSTGAVTGAWRYRGYGQIAASSGTPTPAYVGLGGQLLDPSGLYYMRARWYDAASGRFISRDPLGGDPSHPIKLNTYAYALANPVLYVDPTGLDPEFGDPGVGCQTGLFCHTDVLRSDDDEQVVMGRAPLSFGVTVSFFARKKTPAASKPGSPTTGVPPTALDVLRVIDKTGAAPAENRGGGAWQNNKGQLPTLDAQHRPITYIPSTTFIRTRSELIVETSGLWLGSTVPRTSRVTTTRRS